MLQQTQVATVVPYYRRWMRRFPSIKALAGASEQDVLRLWEGLGYYSRARNLLRAARLVMREYGGRLPRKAEELRRLPGLGPYAAGAIASIAFGEPVPAIDANARRVLLRLFVGRSAVATTADTAQAHELALQHISARNPGDFNQALMELGALICSARSPNCTECPVRSHCRWQSMKHPLIALAGSRVLSARSAARTRHFAALVSVRSGRVLLRRNDSHGLLGGMWSFPTVEVKAQEHRKVDGLSDAFLGQLGIHATVGDVAVEVAHAYSHFAVRVLAFKCDLRGKAPAPLVWVARSRLPDLPMGKVDRLIARTLSAC